MPEDIRGDNKRVELYSGATFYCPKCKTYKEISRYLSSAIADEKARWIANVIAHWRHEHTDWDKSRYKLFPNSRRPNLPRFYEQDKAKVNEYIKQTIIRKYNELLKEKNITSDHFGKLQNNDAMTLRLAKQLLG